ncbi:ribonuclease HIII [Mycoplasmatota bacterium zrk1]
MNFILTVKEKDLIKIKKHYSDNLVTSPTDYVYFMSKSAAVTITAFTSGKVMFQGPIAESEYNNWREYFKSDISTIGSDEVGTGDFFGPIVVVSAYVNESQIEQLTDFGVNDSKKLTDQKILKIGPKIAKIITHKKVFLNNFYYNKLQETGNNMNKIKALMHNRALNQLTTDVKCDKVILDQFASEANYWKYLKDEATIFRNIIFETKAESKYIAVATASILARYYFLRLWNKMSKDYGYEFIKGASNEVDKLAAKILLEKGEDFLVNVAKLNFKNLSKARIINENLL